MQLEDKGLKMNVLLVNTVQNTGQIACFQINFQRVMFMNRMKITCAMAER